MELVRLPKAAENVTESTVVAWLVAEGDHVEAEEPIVEMVNEKAEFEIWPLTSGTVLRITAARNSTVPVGYILAAVGSPGDEVPDIEAENERILAKAREETASGATVAGGAASDVSRAPGGAGVLSSRVRATPAARRLAKERGVELGDVKAALGIDRAVTVEDVEAHLASGSGAGGAGGES